MGRCDCWRLTGLLSPSEPMPDHVCRDTASASCRAWLMEFFSCYSEDHPENGERVTPLYFNLPDGQPVHWGDEWGADRPHRAVRSFPFPMTYGGVLQLITNHWVYETDVRFEKRMKRICNTPTWKAAVNNARTTDIARRMAAGGQDASVTVLALLSGFGLPVSPAIVERFHWDVEGKPDSPPTGAPTAECVVTTFYLDPHIVPRDPHSGRVGGNSSRQPAINPGQVQYQISGSVFGSLALPRAAALQPRKNRDWWRSLGWTSCQHFRDVGRPPAGDVWEEQIRAALQLPPDECERKRRVLRRRYIESRKKYDLERGLIGPGAKMVSRNYDDSFDKRWRYWKNTGDEIG